MYSLSQQLGQLQLLPPSFFPLSFKCLQIFASAITAPAMTIDQMSFKASFPCYQMTLALAVALAREQVTDSPTCQTRPEVHSDALEIEGRNKFVLVSPFTNPIEDKYMQDILWGGGVLCNPQ